MNKEKVEKEEGRYECDECSRRIGVIYKVGDSWLCWNCYNKEDV